MKLVSRVAQINDICRLVLAVVVLVVLAPTQQVSAVEVSSSHGINAAPHHCKCGMRCHGVSCCCGPREARTPPPAHEPPSDSGRADAGPCLNSSPCGDSGLPSAPSGGPVNKGAAPCDGRATAARHGRPLPLVPSSLPPPSSASLTPRSTPGTPHPRLIPGHRHRRTSIPVHALVARLRGKTTSVA